MLRQATPATVTSPWRTRCNGRGTSMRDMVSTTPRGSQSRCVQYAWTWSNRVAVSSTTHLVAEV